jgi:dTDP-glucose 4,6-dehydratase
VRACHHTYGLPTLTTNCSNNYGPYQFPEKFIPLMILNGLREKPMPIYGDGSNIRDWLHVADHCGAVRLVLAKGRAGEVYNIGCRSEMENVDVVKAICALLDEAHPRRAPHEKLVQFVKDRPGHDRRYAMDPRKIERELGWKATHGFAAGLRKTFEWYLDNGKWADNVMSGEYKRWVESNYVRR